MLPRFLFFPASGPDTSPDPGEQATERRIEKTNEPAEKKELFMADVRERIGEESKKMMEAALITIRNIRKNGSDLKTDYAARSQECHLRQIPEPSPKTVCFRCRASSDTAPTCRRN